MAAVIGDPVAHSLSPALHNAAFEAMGLDWVYVAFRVRPGQGGAAVEAMRSLDLGGMSVTMPHKGDVARAVDRLGRVAAVLGVANTVCWSGPSMEPGAHLVGESTDGAGYLDALRGDAGFDPAGRACVVLGGGGAARAVTHALGGCQPASLTVVARRVEQGRSCADLAGPGASVVAPDDREALAGAIRSAALIVNATPTGMSPGDGLPFDVDPGWLTSSQFVSDLVYAPAVTPFLEAARRRGAEVSNGLGMLIHQAARQLELWTGRPAPLEALSAAAAAALGV